MTASDENERRSEKRWEVCLDAVWEGTSGNYSARVTDLSEGGCYIDTMGEASEGEILNFKMLLPSGDWLFLSGEVAHKNAPMGFGVRFANLTEDQIARLQSLIEELEKPHNPSPQLLIS